MTSDTTATAVLKTLLETGRIHQSDWPAELGAAENLGFVRRGDDIELVRDLELLSTDAIVAGLSARAGSWLQALEIHHVIGSTNDHLVSLAASESVNGMVCLAELQTRGRGRRGRTWLSPFAGHLAMSTGMALDRSLGDLAGLSLAVGLAVVDCLHTLDVGDLALKWPNDILLGGRKLGGVLIELVSPGARPGGSVEAVIGVGVNVDVPANLRSIVDQAITDLVGEGYPVSRNALAADLLSSLVDYVQAFEQSGFAPMTEAFNGLHALHGELCEIVEGDRMVVGRVVGVTQAGELALETDSGTRIVGAGEASLRKPR